MRQLKPETPRLVIMQKSSKMEREEGYTKSYLSLISKQAKRTFKVSYPHNHYQNLLNIACVQKQWFQT